MHAEKTEGNEEDEKDREQAVRKHNGKKKKRDESRNEQEPPRPIDIWEGGGQHSLDQRQMGESGRRKMGRLRHGDINQDIQTSRTILFRRIIPDHGKIREVKKKKTPERESAL